MTQGLPIIVVTGDCQALEVAAAAIGVRQLTDRFDILHLNRLGYGDGVELPTEDQAARCVLHWRQATDASPPAVDPLLAHARRLSFPTTSLGVYLPFQVYDEMRPGRTWHGDRVLMTLEEQDLPLGDIPSAYEALSRKTLPSPWKMRAAQLRLLEGQEADCDIKPSAFMAKEMFRQRLFWDFDHAAPGMIGWLLGALLRESFPSDKPVLALAERLTKKGARTDLEHPWQAPIPTAVREYLDLKWVAANERYLYDGRMLTEEEYLLAYATERRAVRRGRMTDAA